MNIICTLKSPATIVIAGVIELNSHISTKQRYSPLGPAASAGLAGGGVLVTRRTSPLALMIDAILGAKPCPAFSVATGTRNIYQ